MSEVKTLGYFVDGKSRQSKTKKFYDIFDPNIGEVIANAPCCTEDEVNSAVAAAVKAFPTWRDVPVMKRVQVLYQFKRLLEEHMDELTMSVCRENGKVWQEAKGDVLKSIEVVELACGTPSLMMGESLMDTSNSYDTVMYREPLGVFVGLVPWNFPAMIPFGWMTPLCIATGNTIILKASSITPMTALRMVELLHDAGLPDGVVNVITCSRNEAEIFLKHPDVKGITFVGSTSVGKHIYSTAAAHGKRVQTLCEAKNHCLVLEDAPLERTAAGIVNATYGCAGERCMALPVVVVQESIADDLVAALKKKAEARIIGPSYDQKSELGPLVTDDHKKFVTDWIETGIKEGAKLVLDGRNATVKGYENGFWLGPSIFDHVKPGMSVGDEEIFGPVTCVKRVKDFEEGIDLMNSNQFANGSAIYTQNGYFSREFVRKTHAGMTGINVGIPVPVGIFPFSGHKNSFFGDLHVMGKDGIRFFTETKCVTTHWFDEEEMKKEKVDTWDGTIGKI
ncbi:MAG: CoA-acylating methylmalonate-semialdehyde dehydrogenase [Anaerolineales bacterium]|jgi:malonate-semialdehyde dehydrogenase (acetylating)/methylmalonate-semialdehyde dehydrogenase